MDASVDTAASPTPQSPADRLGNARIAHPLLPSESRNAHTARAPVVDPASRRSANAPAIPHSADSAPLASQRAPAFADSPLAVSGFTVRFDEGLRDLRDNGVTEAAKSSHAVG